MITRYAYIILMFLAVLVFSTCGRDGRVRHLTGKTEIVFSTKETKGDMVCATELWREGDFELLVPAMSDNIPSQILERLRYVTSYNHNTKCPNWVAWKLTDEHTDGPFSRKGVPYYCEDGTAYGIGEVNSEICGSGYFVDLETKESRQELSDWTGEFGMTHGHMCPAGDNKWDKVAMNQSFLLTNMCPQAACLNGGSWKKLEEKCRVWAKKNGCIYVVAGPMLYGGKVNRTLGNGKIAVPDAFFKVVLCMTGNPKAIGFIYVNNDGPHQMGNAVCSVDNVEKLSGFDFFSSLPDDVEDNIESINDMTEWD